jgi:hypothetical protein
MLNTTTLFLSLDNDDDEVDDEDVMMDEKAKMPKKDDESEADASNINDESGNGMDVRKELMYDNSST